MLNPSEISDVLKQELENINSKVKFEEVGTVLNVVAGATKSSMTRVVKGVTPFLISHLIVLLLLILFPALVTVPAKWFGG